MVCRYLVLPGEEEFSNCTVLYCTLQLLYYSLLGIVKYRPENEDLPDCVHPKQVVVTPPAQQLHSQADPGHGHGHELVNGHGHRKPTMLHLIGKLSIKKDLKNV